MPRIAGSPCPTETEERIEDFLADMRDLATGSIAENAGERWADSHGSAPPLTVYERDRLLYEHALATGMGVAGMVAFSADIMA